MRASPLNLRIRLFATRLILMRQRFKARELLLLLPFLLIGVAAFYCQRQEKVTPPPILGFHLKNFKMGRASPNMISQGYGEKLTVTFSDSTPFTYIPNVQGSQGVGGDALHPENRFITRRVQWRCATGCISIVF